MSAAGRPLQRGATVRVSHVHRLLEVEEGFDQIEASFLRGQMQRRLAFRRAILKPRTLVQQHPKGFQVITIGRSEEIDPAIG